VRPGGGIEVEAAAISPTQVQMVRWTSAHAGGLEIAPRHRAAICAFLTRHDVAFSLRG
jgi:hypothetical protein